MIQENDPKGANQNQRLTLVIIRHGQTTANRAGVIQGQDDSPLTAQGELSSQAKAGKLEPFAISAAYCSDLPRARATLNIIMERLPGLPPPVYAKELREIDFGEYTGAVKAEIMETIAKHKAESGLKYPGGESGADLRHRVKGFIEMLLSARGGGCVLAVTHYGVMETIAREYAGYPKDQPFLFGEEALILLEFADGHSARMEIL